MTTFKRKILLCAIGLIAGLAAWPIAEFTLWMQDSFPTYLLFNIALGIVFGIFIGGFFGTSDGILSSNKRSIIKGVKQGLLFGAVGGLIGFIIGQAALFIVGEYFIHSNVQFNSVGLPLSRAFGWAFLGIFIGMIDGVRSRSKNKIKVGIIGGVTGGIVGGLALEYLRLLLPGIALARLLGLMLFGFCIGLFYSLIEDQLSFGILTLLNGKHKGKDFLITQHSLTIGSSANNDIVIEGYRNIATKHACVSVKNDDVHIKPENIHRAIYANDDKIKKHILRLDDVIKIGSAKLLYHYK